MPLVAADRDPLADRFQRRANPARATGRDILCVEPGGEAMISSIGLVSG
jgi:hypothetical protein